MREMTWSEWVDAASYKKGASLKILVKSVLKASVNVLPIPRLSLQPIHSTE